MFGYGSCWVYFAVAGEIYLNSPFGFEITDVARRLCDGPYSLCAYRVLTDSIVVYICGFGTT